MDFSKIWEMLKSRGPDPRQAYAEQNQGPAQMWGQAPRPQLPMMGQGQPGVVDFQGPGQAIAEAIHRRRHPQGAEDPDSWTTTMTGPDGEPLAPPPPPGRIRFR